MLLHELNDAEWVAIMQYILRVGPNNRTSPPALRATVNAILWRMRTGAPWHCLPKEYGSIKAVHRRFHDWKESGAWRNIVTALAEMRSGTFNAAPIDMRDSSPVPCESKTSRLSTGYLRGARS
jgi:transposase